MFPFSAIVLIGMSGVGKSHWAGVYGKERSLSADEHIADKIFPQLQAAGVAREGEKIDNLAAFVGKFGAERYGGLSREEFFRRQKVYGNAEKDSLIGLSLDLPNWLGRKGKDDVLLYDTTGSFCEVLQDENHPLCQKLKTHACIVYLACSEQEEKILLQRQKERPKPMVYDRDFFEAWLQDYREQESVEEKDIIPDDFLRFVFPKAIAYRRARYEDLADVFVSTDELESLPQENSPPTFAKAFVEIVKDKLSDKELSASRAQQGVA